MGIFRTAQLATRFALIEAERARRREADRRREARARPIEGENATGEPWCDFCAARHPANVAHRPWPMSIGDPQ